MRLLITFIASVLVIGCGAKPEKTDEKTDDYIDKMAVEHEGDKPIKNDATNGDSLFAVLSETVVYHTDGDKTVSGHMAYPSGDVRGSVIMIHEWWGLNDNVREMANKLATEGYRVLAVDLYDGDWAADPEKAKALMTEAMKSPDGAKANLKSAYAFLKSKGDEKVGVMGWCFGGHWSLQTAMLMPDTISATVIYYGRLVDDEAKLKPINMPVLGIFGADDKGIPVESVKKFEATMKKLNKDVSIHIYEGADHAFANPSGTRYQKEAADDAWAKTLAHLEANLK